MIKIGVTAIGYNCNEHLAAVLKPWMELKEACLFGNLIKSVHIAFTHGCFTETAQLGYPIISTDGTIEYLKALHELGDSGIDFLDIKETPQLEYEMWTNNLPYLFSKDIDLLVMLNADELWEINEIIKAVTYIKETEFIDYFKVNFKNYCIDYNHYVSDFIVPRIWWAKKNGGIKRFYRDDLLEYNNGKRDVEVSHKVISPNIIFPKHYSWVGSKEYLQRKLGFQKLRYGNCSYAWDEVNDRLMLNEEFYKTTGLPKPEILSV